MIRDGLYLSICLEEENFDLIESYLKNKNYQVFPDVTNESTIGYIKYEDNGDALSIIFTFGDVQKVSFMFAGSTFSFLSRKLKSLMVKNSHFHQLENPENFAFIFLQKNRTKVIDPDLDIAFATFISLKSNYISFETPYKMDKQIDWKGVFLALPDEFFD